jgi:hypothetical protein
MVVVPMDKRQVRRMSMQGTVLFVLGVMALIASMVTRSLWLGGAAVALVVQGGVMLYRVGKSLS